MSFTAWAIIPLFAFISNSLLGLYVLQRNPSSRINRAFSIYMALFAVWNIGDFGLRIAEDAMSALFWGKFLYLGYLFIAPAFTVFVFRLLDRRINPALIYLQFLPFLLLLPTDLIVSGVNRFSWGYQVQYGLLYPAFGALFLAWPLYSLYLLWQARSTVKKPIVRTKLDLILFPTIIAYLFGGIISVAVPLIFGIYPYPMGHLLTAIMALSIGYAFTLKE